MNNIIRTFLAIDLDPEILQTIKNIQDDLKNIDCDIKWVKPENINLTLKFLGEIKDKRIDAINQALEDLFQSTAPIKTELTELGAFPIIDKPRVLWVGLKDKERQIVQLVASLEKKLLTIGFKKDQKLFTPHITIGRIRSPKNLNLLSQAISNHSLPTGLTQTIQSVTLNKSTLTPQGPIYETLSTFKLDKNVGNTDAIIATPEKNMNLKNDHFVSTLSIFFSTIMIFSGFSYFQKIPLTNIMSKIFTSSYSPHINNFVPLHISGINSYRLAYIILCCSCLLTYLVHKMFKKQQPRFVSILFSTLFIIYALITTLLTINWAGYFNNEIKAVSGKTTEQKYSQFFGRNAFIFSQQCKRILPGYRSAKLITDMDMTRDPGMITHRMLAYFLYPIDIRGIHKEDPNTLIIFAKDNAGESVPDNFKTVIKFNDEYVVAVKKD